MSRGECCFPAPAMRLVSPSSKAGSHCLGTVFNPNSGAWTVSSSESDPKGKPRQPTKPSMAVNSNRVSLTLVLGNIRSPPLPTFGIEVGRHFGPTPGLITACRKIEKIKQLRVDRWQLAHIIPRKPPQPPRSPIFPSAIEESTLALEEQTRRVKSLRPIRISGLLETDSGVSQDARSTQISSHIDIGLSWHQTIWECP